MAFIIDNILSYVAAYVAVVDSSIDVLYRNREGFEERVLSLPDVVLSIKEGIADRHDFGPTLVELNEKRGDTSTRHRLLLNGRYDGQGHIVITVSEGPDARKSEEAIINNLSYIANMSHEIRTPVNAITGFSRLMATTDNPEKKAKFMEQIETNSRLLMKLVDDVLDLAKMNEGEFKIRKQETDINEIIKSVYSTVQFRLQPGTILNYVLGAAECKVMTDPDRLSQIILNLVTNACKFTPKGSITFGYEIRADEIYFFVKDTGIGIDPEIQPLLFKRFFKQNEQKQGNGLGLSICKELVELFDGEIGVESAGKGKGSLFWFTLPVSPVNAGAENIQAAPEPQPTATDKNDARPHLLVAEDNESNYFLISSMLEDDYKLTHAWNGREAVEMYSEEKPDLILMDINMPLMDGYEATKRIRQISADVPVIAVTAYAFSSDRTRIMENGFSSYVSKPVNPDRLMSEIKRLLRK